MIIEVYYRKINTNNYIVCYDNDNMMFECPNCYCRIIAEPFIISVGSVGFSYCPYCGFYLKDGIQEELDMCH